jgi:multidrug transporter EmrE-like cation transporter
VQWFDLYGEPLLLILACVSVAIVFSVVLRPVNSSKADFFTFWDAGRAYRLGLDPYFGIPLRPDAAYNLNAPAVMVVLFAPLASLPLPIAFVVWTAAGVLACLLASVWIARAIASGRWVVIASVILTSQSTFMALQFGQPIDRAILAATAAWTV